MEYRILGPLTVLAGGHGLNLGGPKQRRILAMLLLHPGRPVDVDRLATAVWAEHVPATGRRQVQNAIGALRVLLTKAGGMIDTGPAGYSIRVGRDEVDALVFDRMVAEAQAAGDAKLMREALALWRGPALAGLGDTGPLALGAAGLEEKRLAALEDCLDLELAAGRDESVIAELATLVAAHPLRERLVGQLMTALHHAGRTAEATAVYADLSARLADDLGIDPGAELRRVYDSIRGPAPGNATRPAQLPADVSAFAGRTGELARLDRVLVDAPVGIQVVAGTAGVGKTALAVHWAHRVRDRFPDGQLHVNLRGYAQQVEPMRSLDALARFLRALGVAPETIPAEVDEAAARYRSMLAGKRLLILLDNAMDADHVRPLLPGDGDCLVLVTSRDQLDQLDQLGAGRLTLDVLAPEAARDLLARVLGERRVPAEPAAADELAKLCAYLPLALRIAAANIADRQPITEYVDQLAAGNRLAGLEVEGDRRAAVRAAFDLSYAALPGPAQRVFRLLGLVPGPDVAAEAVAALADAPVAETEDLLRQLTAAHLVDRQGSRYAFHDLLRLFAAEHANREDAASERATALDRLFGHYLATLDAAAFTVLPHSLRLPFDPRPATTFADVGEALGWIDTELPNLSAAVGYAAAHGPRRYAWLLADRLRGYFWLRPYQDEVTTVVQAATAAAETEGNLAAVTSALLGLANSAVRRDDLGRGIEYHTRALAVAGQAGWVVGQAFVHSSLGTVYRRAGQLRSAAHHLERAMALKGDDDGVNQVSDLTDLAAALISLGRVEEALEYGRRALDISRRFGATALEAVNLGILGEGSHLLGRFGEAEEYLNAARTVMRKISDKADEGITSTLLAEVYRDTGQEAAASDAVNAAMSAVRVFGDKRLEVDAILVAASVSERFGALDAALDRYRAAEKLLDGIESRQPLMLLSLGLSAVSLRTGAVALALGQAERALALAREKEYRVFEGQARTRLAEVNVALDRPGDAVDHARDALAIHRETGHRPGEARALRVLGNALAAAGRERAAEAAWQEALALFTEMGMPEAGELAHQVRSSVARSETGP